MSNLVSGFINHRESAPIKVSVADHPVDRVLQVVDPKRASIPPGRKGAPICSLSPSSRRKMAFTARNYAAGMNWFATLTYPGSDLLIPRSGEVVKRHLNVWLTALRRRSPGCRYFWFLEFQGRGAVHFHVFADTLGFDDLTLEAARLRLASEWNRIVFHRVREWASLSPECTDEFIKFERGKHSRAGVKLARTIAPHAPESYAAKEAGKMAQKEVPPWFASVGRFWGVSRGFRQTQPTVVEVRIPQSERALAVAVVDEFERQRVESWAAVQVEVEPRDPQLLRGGRIRSGARQPLGVVSKAILTCQDGNRSDSDRV